MIVRIADVVCGIVAEAVHEGVVQIKAFHLIDFVCFDIDYKLNHRPAVKI